MDRKAILDKYTQNWILKYYPESKQKSDQVDQLFWTSYLVNYTNLSAGEIGKLVYQSATKIMEGKSDLKTEVSSLNSQYGQAQAWEQLIKIGVRVGWVQQIKKLYYEILNDKSITETKLYFVVKEKYFPLYKLK